MSFYFNEKDIYLIIKSLSPKKAHGCGIISIKMIQICGKTIIAPLRIIFEESLRRRKFPETWKKPNVVPVHKKEDRYLLKYDLPITLLPIFSNVFERVIYTSIFNYFLSNNLFISLQSHFLPGGSCTVQLLLRIFVIQTAFDNKTITDVRDVSLDISKYF